MAVDPRILQQYIDAYNQDVNRWQRQGRNYNAAINSYNTNVNTYNAKTQPQIDALAANYQYELNHLQGDVQNYNNNLWATNRAEWDAALADWQNYHYGNANNYNNQITGLEKTIPQAPSALSALFNEKLYLSQNPGVAAAVKKGQYKSGLDHYLQVGRTENRNAAVGGAKAESAVQAAADWQVKAQKAFNDYMGALNASRARSTETDSVFNSAAATKSINARVAEADRLKNAYQEILNQRPELDWFSGQATPGRITNALKSGNSGNIVNAAYSAYLGRRPEDSGLSYWKSQIDSKALTPQQAIDAIRNSEEGNKYGMEFHGKAPTFTQEQVKAMTGNVGLGKQMLQQEGGLIGAELASTSNERNADSMIAGILSKARGRG